MVVPFNSQGVTLLTVVYSCTYTILLLLLLRHIVLLRTSSVAHWHDFRKQMYWYEMCVLIFSTNFVRNFCFISGRMKREVTVNVLRSSRKVPDIFIRL
jgi:hypothetical protein